MEINVKLKIRFTNRQFFTTFALVFCFLALFMICAPIITVHNHKYNDSYTYNGFEAVFGSAPEIKFSFPIFMTYIGLIVGIVLLFVSYRFKKKVWVIAPLVTLSVLICCMISVLYFPDLVNVSSYMYNRIYVLNELHFTLTVWSRMQFAFTVVATISVVIVLICCFVDIAKHKPMTK